MENLNNQRKNFKEDETNQIKLVSKYLNQRRERFNHADTHMWMAQNQNQNDLLELSNQIYDWKDKAKEETPGYKILENMILALFRIESYVKQMETVSKASVSEYIEERKINLKLESEMKTMKLLHLQESSKLNSKIKELENEIEFINKTGKP